MIIEITAQQLTEGYLIFTGILFILNALADYLLKMNSVWICISLVVWCVLSYLGIVNSMFYIVVIGLINFHAFWKYIALKRHIPIIISGVISIWAVHILTHPNGYIISF